MVSGAFCIFTGQKYRFMANAFIGIRVWVDDDQLIIHQWRGQTAVPVSRNHAPRYDTRTVRIEYCDAEANAMTVVNWAVKK